MRLFCAFQVTKFLGKGSYGSVYRVKRFQDDKTYALKEADVQSMNQLERIDSVNEVRLMASLRHPNVVRSSCGWTIITAVSISDPVT